MLRFIMISLQKFTHSIRLRDIPRFVKAIHFNGGAPVEKLTAVRIIIDKSNVKRRLAYRRRVFESERT